MPTFHNTTDVLAYQEGDVRFLPIALPYGFNHWSEAARQLREDNPDFFAEREICSKNDTIGVIACQDANGNEVVRGFMAMCTGSRYVCTDWKQRQGTPTTVPQADILGIAVRKGLVTLLKVKV